MEFSLLIPRVIVIEGRAYQSYGHGQEEYAAHGTQSPHRIPAHSLRVVVPVANGCHGHDSPPYRDGNRFEPVVVELAVVLDGSKQHGQDDEAEHEQQQFLGALPDGDQQDLQTRVPLLQPNAPQQPRHYHTSENLMTHSVNFSERLYR